MFVYDRAKHTPVGPHDEAVVEPSGLSTSAAAVSLAGGLSASSAPALRKAPVLSTSAAPGRHTSRRRENAAADVDRTEAAVPMLDTGGCRQTDLGSRAAGSDGPAVDRHTDARGGFAALVARKNREAAAAAGPDGGVDRPAGGLGASPAARRRQVDPAVASAAGLSMLPAGALEAAVRWRSACGDSGGSSMKRRCADG
jgi:hypothetical protein